MKRVTALLLTAAVAILLSAVLPACNRTATETASEPDFRAVVLLLDIMDTATAHNPGAAAWATVLDTVWGQPRVHLIDSLAASNIDDPVLGRMVDSLLALPAYQLYYQQFRSPGPEDHREMLLRLPYGWVPSAADVSRSLYQISRNTDQIRAMVAASAREIDLEAARSGAMKWLPEGDYPLPPVHFIMDGNGDAFARDQGIVFDLYSVLLRDLLASGDTTEFASKASTTLNGILAHEFHHIFAAPYYQPNDSDLVDWRSRMRYRVTRLIVSEGIAMHCNPLTGFRRRIREDTGVVAFWMADVKQMFAALEDDSLTEEQVGDWFRSSFHERARDQLTAYLGRTYSGDELRRQVSRHLIDRPSMVYTLGWWMVTHISRNRTDREAVLALLRDPRAVYRMYDEAVPDAPDSLRMTAME